MNNETLSLVAGAAIQKPARAARRLLEALFERNLLQHRRLFAELDPLRAGLCEAAALMADTLHGGGRLLFFGNGGSASDSQHLAAEFNGRLKRERAPLAAMALNADTATITAIANDYGFEEVFARQIAAHARPGDCVVALSTSGESPNVLRGLVTASEQGVASVALLGRGGGRARALADLALVVPHDDSARIQEAHIFIGHTWCGQIESALGLVP
jgi:D-sedoheptulose 7-phosphate isomerase